MADGQKRAKGKAANMDPRFAAVAKDPRFHKFPQSQKKVEIDPRFAGESWGINTHRHIHRRTVTLIPMVGLPAQHGLIVHGILHAGLFSNPDFQNVARVDKRGRKVSEPLSFHAYIARFACRPCMQTQLVDCSELTCSCPGSYEAVMCSAPI